MKELEKQSDSVNASEATFNQYLLKYLFKALLPLTLRRFERQTPIPLDPLTLRPLDLLTLRPFDL